MNIVHVLFIVNKIRGERERERDVTKMITRTYEYCSCALSLIKWERERGGRGVLLKCVKKYFKSITYLLSFGSHHTNLFGLNYFGIQRHELETALNWYHSPNDYGKLWQIQNRRHSRHQKVLGFLNFPEMLIV